MGTIVIGTARGDDGDDSDGDGDDSDGDKYKDSILTKKAPIILGYGDGDGNDGKDGDGSTTTMGDSHIQPQSPLVTT